MFPSDPDRQGKLSDFQQGSVFQIALLDELVLEEGAVATMQINDPEIGAGRLDLRMLAAQPQVVESRFGIGIPPDGDLLGDKVKRLDLAPRDRNLYLKDA